MAFKLLNTNDRRLTFLTDTNAEDFLTWAAAIWATFNEIPALLVYYWKNSLREDCLSPALDETSKHVVEPEVSKTEEAGVAPPAMIADLEITLFVARVEH